MKAVFWNIMLICPLSRSMSAGPLPLYGTSIMSSFVCARNIAIDMNEGLPVPPVP